MCTIDLPETQTRVSASINLKYSNFIAEDIFHAQDMAQEITNPP